MSVRAPFRLDVAGLISAYGGTAKLRKQLALLLGAEHAPSGDTVRAWRMRGRIPTPWLLAMLKSPPRDIDFDVAQFIRST